MNDAPQIPPRTSFEKIQNLENVIQDLSNRNQAFEKENSYYKTLCQQLESQITRMKAPNNDDDNNSITAINESFVDITATNLCADIENCLEETNKRLTDENNVKDSFEFLISKLADLVMFQYNSKDLVQLTRLKNDLFRKMNSIDEKIQKSIMYEKKIIEIENTRERLSMELNAVKAAYSCKQMIDTSQIDTLSSEFMKWKEEIKAIHLKVQDQNLLIKELTEKCKPKIEEKITPLPEIQFVVTQTNDNFDETLIITQKFDNLPPNNDIPKPIEIVKNDTKTNDEDNNDSDSSSDASPGTSPSYGFENLIRSFSKHNKDDDKNKYPSYSILDSNNFDTMTNNQTLLPTTDDNFNPNQNQINSKDNQNNKFNDSVHLNNTNFSNYDSFINPENEKKSLNTNTYECPFCSVIVEKETVNYEVFVEHVNKCSENTLTCMFCLKLFKKDENSLYIKHVDEHVQEHE